MNKISLPYPISANRYWRNMKGRMVVSAEARAYKQVAAWNALQARTKLTAGDVRVMITFHPKTTKKGLSSRCRLDLDNCNKVVLDALNGVAFGDDKQIVDLHSTIGKPLDGGGVTVEWGAVDGN